MEDPDLLLAALLRWARTDERVDAVVLTGSRAREHGVDEWSDLDVEIIGPGWQQLAADHSWYEAFAEVMLRLTFDQGQPWPSRLVVYDSGRKVDFTIAAAERLHDMTAQGLDVVYRRGYRVLFDRAAVTSRLPEPVPWTPLPPDPALLQRAVQEFWFEATQVPVYLLRGELWVAASRARTMQEMTVRMLAWVAASDPDAPLDPWHNGAHLREWLPQHQWPRLAATFAHFDTDDAWRALQANIDFFDELHLTLTRRLGSPDDRRTSQSVRTHVKRLRDRRLDT